MPSALAKRELTTLPRAPPDVVAARSEQLQPFFARPPQDTTNADPLPKTRVSRVVPQRHRTPEYDAAERKDGDLDLMGTFETAAQELGAIADAVVEQSKSLNRQRELVEQLASAVRRTPPNLSAIRRLLDQPASTDLRKSFPSSGALLDELRDLARNAWNDFSLNAGAEFRRLAMEDGLVLDGQMPKVSVGRGIEVVFRLNENKTIVNGVTIQTVDPIEVFEKVRSEHERLWGGDFDPEQFMAELYRAFREELLDGRASSEGVPIRAIYDRMQGDLSKSAKKAFGLEVFAAKLSRAMEAGARTPDGKVLELRPVREPRDAIYVYLPERGERAHRGLVSFREARQ